MRPEVSPILGKLAANLLGEIAPRLPVDYLQKSTMLVSMMLMVVAEEWDRAAERRVEENRVLRRLFGEVAPGVADRGLRSRLEEAAGAHEESLSLSALDRANDALRSLLIDLHSGVEEQEGSEARKIEAAIWQELRTSTQRRALSMDPF
jgi:hypothetical protein